MAGQDDEDDTMVPGFGFGGGGGGGGSGAPWWGKEEDTGDSGQKRGAYADDDYIPGFGSAPTERPNGPSSHQSGNHSRQDSYVGGGEKDEFGRDREFSRGGGGGQDDWGRGGGDRDRGDRNDRGDRGDRGGNYGRFGQRRGGGGRY